MLHRKSSSDGGSSEETNIDKLTYAASTGNLNISDILFGELHFSLNNSEFSTLVGKEGSLCIIVHRQFHDVFLHFATWRGTELNLFERPVVVSITNCFLLKTDGTTTGTGTSSDISVGCKRTLGEYDSSTLHLAKWKNAKYTVLPSEQGEWDWIECYYSIVEHYMFSYVDLPLYLCITTPLYHTTSVTTYTWYRHPIAVFQLDRSHGAVIEQIFCNQLLRDFNFIHFDSNTVVSLTVRLFKHRLYPRLHFNGDFYDCISMTVFLCLTVLYCIV